MLDADVTDGALAAEPAAASRVRQLTALLRRHLALVILLSVAGVLRVLALVAIYPGIWFPDSNEYVRTATTGVLSILRVTGYSLAVAPFVRVGGFGPLIVLQHLFGLVIVAVLYALLLHLGASRLVAFLAVVPAALDAYLIALEHMVLSETVFHLSVVGGLALLLWKEVVTSPRALAAGVLLGYAVTVRTVALPFIVIVVAYLLLRRVGLYPLAALCLGWAVLVGGYLTLFKIQHGDFAFSQYDGHFLYSQAAPLADCSEFPDLPADERSLCPDPRRRLSPNGYLWSKASPAYGLGASEDDRLHDFSVRVIKHEFGRYVLSVASDFVHYFEPGYRQRRFDVDPTRWEFPANPYRWKLPGYRGPIRPGRGDVRFEPHEYVRAVAGEPSLNATASRFLHYYQRFAATSGQVLAICVLVVAAALVRGHAWRLRLDAALLAACALAGLLVASALSIYSIRYGLLAVVLLPAAAGLAVTSFRVREKPAERSSSRAAATPA